MQTKDINKLAKLALSPLSAALTLAVMTPAIQAKTYLVDAVKKSDGLSLNEALQASMDSREDDLIEFASSLKDQTVSMHGVYAYSSETGSITIDGSGAENLTIKLLEGEGDVGFVAYNSSISVNDLNLVIDRENAGSSGPFEITAFSGKYGAEINLENVVISQADTSEGGAIGIFLSKYSSLNMQDVVIDGSGEGEGIYGGIFASANSNVTIDRAILNDLSIGLYAIQGFGEGGNLPGVMNIDISNAIFSNNEDAGLIAFTKYSEGEGSALIDLSIMNSTFNDNAGAIGLVAPTEYASISADIFNATIVNNHNTKYENTTSALYAYGKVDLRMSHTTITGNTSGKREREGDVAVRIMQYYGSDLSISNSIIAGNTANKYIDEETGYDFMPADILIYGDNEGEGGVVSSLIGKDHFLDDDQDARDSDLYGKGVIYGKNPLFKEDGLQYNKEAETPTLCLSENSPAVDAANGSITKILKLDLDQTGKGRLDDTAPDMGSVEFSSSCKSSSDSSLFGGLGTISLASLFSLAWFRRRKV